MTPSGIVEMSADVPPMSTVMTFFLSDRPAAQRPPMTPPAGPDGGETARLDDCHQAQRDFLHDHLLEWVPGCLALVETHAETDYYRGTARLALGSLAESARLCGMPSK